jgi:hypothetical protein
MLRDGAGRGGVGVVVVVAWGCGTKSDWGLRTQGGGEGGGAFSRGAQDGVG